LKIVEEKISELLRLKKDGCLYHRENQTLEFKEQFNFAGLTEYFRDFAAFANNAGGYLIFGVTNSPRRLVGLNSNALDQFEKIDAERISGSLLETFSPNINWEQNLFKIKNKSFGIFYIYESKMKPVIAKKDEGKDQLIKNGDIFFRYSGRTQKIQYAELHNIIQKRIDAQDNYWAKLISKIAKIGPSNAAILDTERGIIEKNERQILVIDESLTKKIKFLKEGEFSEKEGAIALKLVGEVHPIDYIEVIKERKRNLLELYPLSCTQLIEEIKKIISNVNQNDIYKIIKDSTLKNNPDYSVYNFRNRTQEEEYEKFGKLPKAIPSIYNSNAIGYIVNLLKSK